MKYESILTKIVNFQTKLKKKMFLKPQLESHNKLYGKVL